MYHHRPDFRVLQRIRGKLDRKWKYVGHNLKLAHEVIANIERNVEEVDEQTFKMFEKWMEQDVSSCYCKLISAMEEENLGAAVESLKDLIKTYH